MIYSKRLANKDKILIS